MAPPFNKRDVSPSFLVGQVVDILPRRPGTDMPQRGIVTSVSERIVHLKDGTRWRASDGYAWGVKGDRWTSRHIVPSTGHILWSPGLFVGIEEGQVVLTGRILRAHQWRTRDEAEKAIVELGLRGAWEVMALAPAER